MATVGDESKRKGKKKSKRMTKRDKGGLKKKGSREKDKDSELNEEATQRQQGKKEKGKGQQEEESSVLAKKDKGKTKSKPLPPEVESCISTFVKYACDTSLDVIKEEFVESVASVVPALTACTKFTANMERNRYPETPCLDENRIVLKPPVDGTGKENDYIHANKMVFEKADREFVATQSPKNNNGGFEDFWRMIFQGSSPAVILLTAFYEDGQQRCEEFWPIDQGTYKHYGKMWINNKKVEHVDQYTIYTLEVLPDGCSNSLITHLAHCSTWPDQGVASSGRMILRMVKWLKTLEPGTATIACSAGVGRACTYIAIEVTLSKLFNGCDVKVRDVCVDLRRQRALAVNNELQYIFIYSTVLDYIRAKLPKYNASVSKFFTSLRAVSKDD